MRYIVLLCGIVIPALARMGPSEKPFFYTLLATLIAPVLVLLAIIVRTRKRSNEEIHSVYKSMEDSPWSSTYTPPPDDKPGFANPYPPVSGIQKFQSETQPQKVTTNNPAVYISLVFGAIIAVGFIYQMLAGH
jgi:hypothetical protein